MHYRVQALTHLFLLQLPFYWLRLGKKLLSFRRRSLPIRPLKEEPRGLGALARPEAPEGASSDAKGFTGLSRLILMSKCAHVQKRQSPSFRQGLEESERLDYVAQCHVREKKNTRDVP